MNAYVVKPVGFQEFIEAIQELGVFWAVLNEPPPGRSSRVRRAGADRGPPAVASDRRH